MGYPVLSYNITNGTTTDANKVMQNYNDLLNGVTDGTKDLNVKSMAVNDNMTLKHLTTPAANPTSGYVKTWVDSNNIMKWLNASGVSGRFGGGSGGSTINWELIYAPAPEEDIEQGFKTLKFSELDSQGMYAHITVPSDYISGRQIYLKGAKFACTGTSGNILFRTRTYIMRPEVTEMTALVNYHDAVNTQLTLATADVLRAVGDLDLTDSSGLIDSLTVQADDTLLVLFQRNITSESVSATFPARLLRDSFYPVFS